MADEARAQRQAALADKKRRLEELKARRNQRDSTRGPSSGETTKVKANTANLDDYIKDLLKTPATSVTPATNEASATPVAATERQADGDKVDGDSAAISSDNVIAVPAPAPAAAPVRKAETFDTGTQTADEDFPPPSDLDEDEQPEEAAGAEFEGGVEPSYRSYVEDDFGQDQAKILSLEEVEREVTTDTFSKFLNTASKKVERVLGTPLLADLFSDYIGESDGLKRVETKSTDGGKYVVSRQVYECTKWTATRDVTDMDWSPLHRELMLSSYHMPASSSSLGQPVGSAAVAAISPADTPSSALAPRSGELQSDGLALVWSLAMPTRPEHIFTCGSPVTSARFHPSEAPLVIGGCQSGQVVVWDVRCGRMPVQKSSLTTTGSKCHTHPICAMEFIGGNSGLVTGASDGRVNFWSLANLRDPAESLQVGDSVSCLAIAPESDTLVCGDEFGTLYAVQSSQTSLGGGGGGQRSRRQVRKIDAGSSEGHFGMITSLSTRKLKEASRAGFSKGFLRNSGGLVLTSGVDWNVKLWAPAHTDKPLLSLVSHSYDYMSDIQWCPAHPALCATASSNGTIGLWNFAQSLEEPITGSDGIVVEPDAGSGRGLNKLKWSSDGRRMLVASADRVHVLALTEDVVRQKGDEDSRMMNNLTSHGLLDRE